MAAYTLTDLSFFYPSETAPALCGLNVEITEGEFLTVCGASGSGKSTLLRQLKSVLAPNGRTSGEILFFGERLASVSQREQSSAIGFVLQDPDNQIVTDKVWHELAFGLESLGYDTPTIRTRVAEMASFFGIGSWFHKDVRELSGGQKQLLNLAAIMTLTPKVLILDEPTSQLDPIAATDFINVVGRINRELGVTVILTEHRLDEVFPLSHRVLLLDQGRLEVLGTAEEVAHHLKAKNHPMAQSLPVPMRIWQAVDNDLPCPVTVREARLWLEEYASSHSLHALTEDKFTAVGDQDPLIELEDLWFRYEQHEPDVVKGLNLSVYRGEFLAVLGGNGAGKTTSLMLIQGIKQAYRGRIRIGGRLMKWKDRENWHICALPQNPQALLGRSTLYEDLLEVLESRRMPKDERQAAILRVARLCRLEPLLKRHPYDLSGGEMQRAALAKVLLTEPQILLLDEPTKGLDNDFKSRLAAIIRSLTAAGVTVIMVSHDIEFCAKYADRCALFFDGGVVSCADPRSFFSGNSFYTTASNRIARKLIPRAVIAEDVIYACGGKLPPDPDPPNDNDDNHDGDHGEDEVISPLVLKDKDRLNRNKLTGRTWFSLLVILIALPLTIILGSCFLEDRKYLIISILVLVEAMLPFFLVFEGRRPQARELVIIAVLCALGVAGRAAFFALPQFKPVIALVIISGVALGGETGFLVGALTMLVSNIFMGQGPWTPWQMFAMGLIGLLAGIIFHKRLFLRNRIGLCVFGVIAAVVIYGGLMNPTMVLLAQDEPTWSMILAAYASGVAFDLVQAVATVIFLWLFADPMLEKLDRIRIKYGLIQD